jgi:hypothetical protein
MSNSFRTVCILCSLLIIYLGNPAFAQENHLTISGKIIDKETTQPVPFANIGVSGKSMGTVSNQQGEFIIKIPSAYKVSIVG